jgi:hypothetical protein
MAKTKKSRENISAHKERSHSHQFITCASELLSVLVAVKKTAQLVSVNSNFHAQSICPLNNELTLISFSPLYPSRLIQQT